MPFTVPRSDPPCAISFRFVSGCCSHIMQQPCLPMDTCGGSWSRSTATRLWAMAAILFTSTQIVIWSLQSLPASGPQQRTELNLSASMSNQLFVKSVQNENIKYHSKVIENRENSQYGTRCDVYCDGSVVPLWSRIAGRKGVME